VPDLPHDADDDVIAAGREPSADLLQPLRPGLLARLVLIVETVALAVSVAVALHYRTEASRLAHGRPPAGRQLVAVPRLTTVTLRMPRDGSIAGTVLITAAVHPGGRQAQFSVSATITGGRPDTVYDLTGNDCSAANPPPDHAWASGVTDAAGTAELSGHAWAVTAADAYWLALSPSPVSPPPGLRGTFTRGTATPFPAGQAPCG
jgi:hypothetical protein